MKVKLSIGVPQWLDRLCAWPVMLYRRRKYGYSFRKIDLGEGKWTILDQQDFYRLGKFKWFVNGNGKKFYAVRNIIIGPGRTKIISMHREIMNAPVGLLVDHRNRIPLDNRRDNLRFATQSQNMFNRQKRKNTSSQFIGVYLDNRNGRWVAKIVVNGKRISLGCFDSELDAAKSYDEAAKKYHGEFASLNFTP